MPNILIRPIERAKSNRNTQQTLAAPVLRRYNLRLTNRLRFAIVNCQFQRPFHVLFEYFFQSIVIFVLKNLHLESQNEK